MLQKTKKEWERAGRISDWDTDYIPDEELDGEDEEDEEENLADEIHDTFTL